MTDEKKTEQTDSKPLTQDDSPKESKPAPAAQQPAASKWGEAKFGKGSHWG
jgi:hypothetical protein